MCVHVSVLVSVYIIRVHCPLHHILDTFYGLFAKKIKSAQRKNITKLLSVYILTLVQIKWHEIKVQEMKLKLRDEICS